MLNDKEERIAQIFINKRVSNDNFIGFICALRQENACDEMLKWLSKNEQADEENIRAKIWEILGIAE